MKGAVVRRGVVLLSSTHTVSEEVSVTFTVSTVQNALLLGTTEDNSPAPWISMSQCFETKTGLLAIPEPLTVRRTGFLTQ
jgi:hypothetical protein